MTGGEKTPCDRCGHDAGLQPFYFRIKVFNGWRVTLCPRCAGRLVNGLIAYCRSRQRSLRASLDMEKAWKDRMAENERTRQDQERNPVLPLKR